MLPNSFKSNGLFCKEIGPPFWLLLGLCSFEIEFTKSTDFSIQQRFWGVMFFGFAKLAGPLVDMLLQILLALKVLFSIPSVSVFSESLNKSLF